jgi:hypothetical protein
VGEEKKGREIQSGPSLVPIDDPEFADDITEDLAMESGAGLQLTRDPNKKSTSEPGIKLKELGLEPAKKPKK